MRKFLFLLLSFYLIISTGCMVTNQISKETTYNYEYKLISPIESNKLLYENDTFAIAFDITNNSISIKMINVLNKPIKLVWDDAAMVVYGKTNRVAHAGVKYNEVNNSLPPVTIPAKANLTDDIISSSSVHFEEGSYNYITGITSRSKWITDPFFPTKKSTMTAAGITNPNRLKGQKISLLLPISIDGDEKYYNFVFEVINVTSNIPLNNFYGSNKNKR